MKQMWKGNWRSTEKPYYRGCKYNETAMVDFMMKLNLIMDVLHVVLLSLSEWGRCKDKEVYEVWTKYEEILHVIDGLFSICHIYAIAFCCWKGGASERNRAGNWGSRQQATEGRLIDQIVGLMG